MVNTSGPTMSQSVVFRFVLSCLLVFSCFTWLLVLLPLTWRKKPIVALRAPKLSLVLELGSDTGLK